MSPRIAPSLETDGSQRQVKAKAKVNLVIGKSQSKGEAKPKGKANVKGKAYGQGPGPVSWMELHLGRPALGQSWLKHFQVPVEGLGGTRPREAHPS